MHGGRFLAEERGAFDELAECEAPAPSQEADPAPALVALYEAAAAHDGQPASDWLRVFMRAWKAGELPVGSRSDADELRA